MSTGNLVFFKDSRINSLQKEEKGKDYHQIERRYGSFKRSFRIPGAVKSDEIDASYRDGRLSISLPKAEKKQDKGNPDILLEKGIHNKMTPPALYKNIYTHFIIFRRT